VPAPPPGGGPCRPRGRTGRRLPADAPAGASGDAHADRRRPRRVLRGRDRGARALRLSAVRPPREPHCLGAGPRGGRRLRAPPHADVRLLGPAEAPLALVRGRHRFRLLAKSPRAFDLSAWLRGWLAKAPKRPANMRLDVDVDPQSFL